MSQRLKSSGTTQNSRKSQLLARRKRCYRGRQRSLRLSSPLCRGDSGHGGELTKTLDRKVLGSSS